MADQGGFFPMLFDDGSHAMVPSARVNDAFNAGGRFVHPMTFDDGSKALVPYERVHDAMANGGQLIPASSIMSPQAAQAGMDQVMSPKGQPMAPPSSLAETLPATELGPPPPPPLRNVFPAPLIPPVPPVAGAMERSGLGPGYAPTAAGSRVGLPNIYSKGKIQTRGIDMVPEPTVGDYIATGINALTSQSMETGGTGPPLIHIPTADDVKYLRNWNLPATNPLNEVPPELGTKFIGGVRETQIPGQRLQGVADIVGAAGEPLMGFVGPELSGLEGAPAFLRMSLELAKMNAYSKAAEQAVKAARGGPGAQALAAESGFWLPEGLDLARAGIARAAVPEGAAAPESIVPEAPAAAEVGASATGAAQAPAAAPLVPSFANLGQPRSPVPVETIAPEAPAAAAPAAQAPIVPSFANLGQPRPTPAPAIESAPTSLGTPLPGTAAEEALASNPPAPAPTAAQMTKARQVLDNLRNMNSTVDEGGPTQAATIHLDDAAHQALTGMGLGGGRWRGINLPVDDAQNIATELRNRANAAEQNLGEPAVASNMRSLAHNINRVSTLNYDPDAGHAGVPLIHNPATFAHEADIHGGQRALAGGQGDILNFTDATKTLTDPNDPTGAAIHPAVEKAAPVLQSWGYPNVPAVTAAEMQAHILDGNWDKLGLTQQEAIDWMKHSKDVLAEYHGPQVMDNVPRLAQRYVDALDKFIGVQHGATEAATTPETPQQTGAGAEYGANAPLGQNAEGAGGQGNRTVDTGPAQEVTPPGQGRLFSRPINREDEGGLVFASPNVSQLATPEEALGRIGGAAHESYRNIVDQLHEGLGTKGTSNDSVGLWSDGAENSVMTNHAAATPDQLRYMAAVQGKWGNQKSALWFARDAANDPDSHYNFFVKSGTMQDSQQAVSRRLQQAGVPFANITKVKGGYQVDVVDLGSQLHDNAVEAARRFGVPDLERSGGQGGYIGADPNITDDAAARADAQKAYAQVIAEAESRNNQWGTLRNSIEAGRDYNRLGRGLQLAQEQGPLITAEHVSPQGNLTQASNLSTQLTGDQPPGQYKYRTALNREDYYDIRQDPEQLFAQAKNQGQLEKLAKQAGYRGLYDTANNQITDFKGARISPDFIPQDVKQLFTPDVMAEIKTPAQQRTFLDNIANVMPPVAELEAAAQQGISGKLWYQRSNAAYDALSEASPEMFHPADKQRFMDFLAALSPQQSVPENIEQAIPGWVRWVQGIPDKGIAPRSTAIDDLRQTVLPGDVGNLPARLANAHRALMGENLSGYKVSDFAPALQGDLSRAVIDRIMSAFVGKEQSLSRPEHYYAVSTAVKRTAEKLGWQPSEVQAAVWVWTEALLQKTGLAQGTLKAAPADVASQMTPGDVAGTKASRDVLDLLQQDPNIRAKLRDRAGVNLEQLDKALAAREVLTPKPTGQGSPVPYFLRSAARRVAEGRLGKPIPPEWQGSFPTQ